jgi:lysophospholipase L1-like esterase
MAGGFLTGGGTHYRIGNFGHPRGTVIDHGLENPKAILRSDELKLAERFAPDILVLGPFGDHESQTKESLDRFTPDLRRLLDRIAAFPHPPVVLLALPIPRAHQDGDESYRRIRDETSRIAAERKLGVIDLWSALMPRAEFYADATHLTVPGRRFLATVVADAIKTAPTSGR